MRKFRLVLAIVMLFSLIALIINSCNGKLKTQENRKKHRRKTIQQLEKRELPSPEAAPLRMFYKLLR